MQYVVSENDLTVNLNCAKEVLANNLLSANVLSEEQARIIKEDFALVLVKKGLFGKAIDKLINWGEDKNPMIIELVQVNNIKYNNKEKKNVNKSEDSDSRGMDLGTN